MWLAGERVPKIGSALLAVGLLAVPALAYHRQTPPIVGVTFQGDTPLPRVSAGGRRLVVALSSSGRQIFRQDRGHNLLDQITTVGDNANPTISASANVIAWDTDCGQITCQEPGRQIFMWVSGQSFQASHDPTGTSIKPALSGKGTRLAFESKGDLEPGQNPTGARQIFVRGNDGVVTQVSHGPGTSSNVGFDRSGFRLVFDSTNDLSGNNTGVSQIWYLSRLGYAQIITNGAGPSQRPAMSSDGHWVAFDSTADLTHDGHDTHVSQVFVYSAAQQRIMQASNNPAGCTGASVSAVPADMSVGYTCNGVGYFYHLVSGKHFQLPIDGGDTAQAVAELGGHFMVVSTTANMLGSGTTSGHQVYMLNLFKLAAIPLD